MSGNSFCYSNPLFEFDENGILPQQKPWTVAGVSGYYMYVIVRNGLTTRDSVVLIDIEPDGVECIVDRVPYPSHEAC
jgi:hypothetical protein